MKRKKILSLFLAVVMVMSTVMAVGIPASATLMNIETIEARVSLDDYAKYQQSQIPLKDVLSHLVHRTDKYERDENGSIVRDEYGYYKYLYRAGDPIEIPEDATTVWVNYVDKNGKKYTDEYRVLDPNAVMYLSNMNNSTIELIVGNGRQLDPDNVRYNVNVSISSKYTADFDFKFFKLDENGEKAYIESERDYYTYKYRYVSNDIFDVNDNDDIYFEVTPKLLNRATKAEEPFDKCTLSFRGSEETDEENVGKFIEGKSAYVNATFYDQDGNELYYISSDYIEFVKRTLQAYVENVEIYTLKDGIYEKINTFFNSYDKTIELRRSFWPEYDNLYIKQEVTLRDITGKDIPISSVEITNALGQAANDDGYILFKDAENIYRDFNATFVLLGDTDEEGGEEPPAESTTDDIAEASEDKVTEGPAAENDNEDVVTKSLEEAVAVSAEDPVSVLSEAEINELIRRSEIEAIMETYAIPETFTVQYSFKTSYNAPQSKFEFKFYTMDGGIKKYLTANESTGSGYYRITYYHINEILPSAAEIYVEPSVQTTVGGYQYNNEVMNLVYNYSPDGSVDQDGKVNSYDREITFRVNYFIGDELIDANETRFEIQKNYIYTKGNFYDTDDKPIQNNDLTNGQKVKGYVVTDVCDTFFKDKKDNVIKAVEGLYDSLEAAASQEDIKDALLGDGFDKEYGAGPVNFTLFINNGENTIVHHIKEELSQYPANRPSTDIDEELKKDPVPPAKKNQLDTFFNVTGAYDADGNALPCFIVNNSSVTLDSYYGYGFQTLFVMPFNTDEPVDLSNIRLKVSRDPGASIYRASDGVMVIPEYDYQNFSGGGVQYVVSTQEKVKSYFVNVIALQNMGGQLYVNGPVSSEEVNEDSLMPTERFISFDNYFGDKHEILIANIGDRPLTNLTVTGENLKNVKIDEYWTVENDTMSSFTSVISGKMNNLAKIRLLPDFDVNANDDDRTVSGKLIITAGENGEQKTEIMLSGTAENPKISTAQLANNAVKYVPYFSIVATNNYYNWNKATFSVIDEDDERAPSIPEGAKAGLPEGVSLNPATGELYGVPQEAGTYIFTICATYSEEEFEPSYKTYTLTVADNTNINVYEASDENYGFKATIGEEANEGQRDYVVNDITGGVELISEGEYDNFRKVWLDGKELDVDKYTSESGSTRIVIFDETIGGLDDGSSHTIAIEFREEGEDGKEDLKRTAQNFVIDLDGDDPDDPNNPDNPDNPNNPDVPNDPDDPVKPGTNTGNNSNNNFALPDNGNNNTNVNNENDDSGETGSESTGNNSGNTTGGGNDTQSNTTALESSGVNISATVTDANGNAIAGLNVELHSDVKTAVTDSNGKFVISAAEFGQHTLILKKDSDSIYAEKKFELVESNAAAISEDSVSAVNGANISLDIVLDGNNIRFTAVSSSNNIIGGADNVGNAGIGIGDEDKAVPTGVTFPACVTVAVLSAMGIVVLNVRRKH